MSWIFASTGGLSLGPATHRGLRLLMGGWCWGPGFSISHSTWGPGAVGRTADKEVTPHQPSCMGKPRLVGVCRAVGMVPSPPVLSPP